MRDDLKVMPTFTVFVPGWPAPKGSITQGVHRGRRFVRESSRRVAPWVDLIDAAASYAWRRRPPLESPVVVRSVFYLPRPRTNTDPYPTRRGSGDVDKLVRAVLDGLQRAKVLTDDANVVESSETKLFASGAYPPGVLIHAWTPAPGWDPLS